MTGRFPSTRSSKRSPAPRPSPRTRTQAHQLAQPTPLAYPQRQRCCRPGHAPPAPSPLRQIGAGAGRQVVVKEAPVEVPVERVRTAPPPVPSLRFLRAPRASSLPRCDPPGIPWGPESESAARPGPAARRIYPRVRAGRSAAGSRAMRIQT